MTRKSTFLATAMAAGAMLFASPASAQADRLDPAAVTAAARYALPVAFDGFLQRCSSNLAPSGFAIRNASDIRAKFSEGSAQAWPAAKAAMLQLASEEAGDMTAILGGLNDDDLRPFVDGLVQGLVSQEIKLDDCSDIERGLEILDPLPAENTAALIGFFFELGAREEAEDDGEAKADAAQ